MKLFIEIADKDGEGWKKHREIELFQRESEHGDILDSLLSSYDQLIELNSNSSIMVSAHYNLQNKHMWIMVQEEGKHKSSIEAISDVKSTRLIFSTSEETIFRFSIVE